MLVKMDHVEVTSVIAAVLELKAQHINTWRNGEDDMFWLARLMQEMGELASSLVDDHEHPPETELQQIAAIAMNWIEYRHYGKG